MTLTIELPDDLAERLQAAAAARGEELNHYAVAALAEGVAAIEAEEPDPALIAALREGVADLKAGRLRSLEQVDAAVDAALTNRRTERLEERAA